VFVQTQSLAINPAFYGDSCIAQMCWRIFE